MSSSTYAPDDAPLVSVVTVNLNGQRFLGDLLRSLEAQSWPRSEIQLVDNGSSDGSVAYVERNFPRVQVIRAGRNLGFAAGNNLGIRRARGEWVALINNDAVADTDWLTHMVEEARCDPAIGGVGSKIVFFRPFVPLRLEVQPATAEAAVWIAASSRFETCAYRKTIFERGFGPPETHHGEPARRLLSAATLYLPVDSLAAPGPLLLRLGGDHPSGEAWVRVSVDGAEVGRVRVGRAWDDHRLEVPVQLARRAGFDVINNAASSLTEDGTVADRGIFEPDRGQYDRAEDVTALCGCSMMLSRRALDRVGLFDRDLFMYFEDTELSWRLRKAGFRLRYQPASVVRHHHASTTVEWSPRFNFFVGRNRVLMLLRHGAPRTAADAWARELARFGRTLLHWRRWRHPELRTRLRIQLSLLLRAPRILLRRLFS